MHRDHRKVLRTFSDAFRRLVRRENGMAAVEFSLILPILVVLWIGGVEVTQALSVDRRINNLTSSVGDLTARAKELTYNKVDEIFDLAPGAMYPYCSTEANCLAKGLSVRVTAIDIDDDGNSTVAWSRALGTSTYVDNQIMDTVVPNTLRQNPDSQVILSEVTYTYTPAVGYVITGDIDLSDRTFFVPRLTDHVSLCDNNGENCK